MRGLIEVPVDEIRIKFPDAVPLEGFELPKGFSNCCGFHTAVNTALQDWFQRFPDCCDDHRAIAKKDWFRKEDFTHLPEKILLTLAYAQHFIEHRINGENYVKDITDYFEHLTLSFDHPPIGASQFHHFLKIYLEFYPIPELPKDRIPALLQWFGGGADEEENGEATTSLTVLEDTYQKWLAAFPFSISFFQQFKPALQRQAPFFSGGWEENRYTGFVSSKLCTRRELIFHLNKVTQDLLQKVDTATMMSNGEITDTQKQRVDLAGAAHRLRQQTLLYKYEEDEQEYVGTISGWLLNEKEYFAEVAALLAPAPTHSAVINAGEGAVVQVQQGAADSSQHTALPSR